MEIFFLTLYLIIMTLTVFTFVIAFFMAIFSKKKNKLASKLLIGSVIVFIIGFGGCIALISLS
ncbi:hypothetical protein AS885_08650 [Flavobacterium psychrophilum]|nr:hypothetical protein AS885_08650 [Flavobacterium psychrophilum]